MKIKRWLILALSIFMIACGNADEKPTEAYVLGDNLSGAISQMALALDDYDASITKEDYYPKWFLSNYCQNSRFGFTYLDKVVEENGGMLTQEQVEYIQYSLTMENVDFKAYVPEKGLDRYDTTSSLGSGKIISYEAEYVEDGIKLMVEFERSIDEFRRPKLYELTVVLAENPESCFDGYSIKLLTSKDVTPILYGDNEEHVFRGNTMDMENNGVFLFETCFGDDEVEYGMYVNVDLTENGEWAKLVRENSLAEFEVTYLFDDTMTQPVAEVVPIDIELLGDAQNTETETNINK